jgi:hypothetical protein
MTDGTGALRINKLAPDSEEYRKMELSKKSPPTTLWLHHAIKDYACARCLLLHGLSGGFIFAQQALEKLLKAYLSHAHPGHKKFVGKDKLIAPMLKVNPSHDLVAHLLLAEKSYPSLKLDPQKTELIANLSYCFQSKYPDVETPLNGTTTAWLNEIDRVFINWSLEVPLSDDVRWRTGLYVCVWNDVIGRP